MKTPLSTSFAMLALLALSGCATTSMNESTYSGDAQALAAEKTSSLRKFIGRAFSTPMPAWQAPLADSPASGAGPDTSSPAVVVDHPPESENTLKSFPIVQGDGDSHSSFTIEAETKPTVTVKK